MANSFEGQNKDEDVLFIFRRHPIVIRKAFYLLLIPFVLASIPTLIWPDNLNNLWLALGGLLLGCILFFYHWMGWYFSIFIVTNQRLRQVTQKGMFDRGVIDVGISKIQNISYNIPGFTASALGFGNIVVQTYVGDLMLDRVHHPMSIYNKLQAVVQKYGNVDTTNENQNYEETTE